MNNTDLEYNRLLNVVLKNGKIKKNRTGINTIGIFGEQAKFNIDLDAFPILTTKKVWFKGILHELLWFIKGDTNIKYLVDNDVHIWDEWAYKRFGERLHTENSFGCDYADTEGKMLTQEQFILNIKQSNGKTKFAERWGKLGEGTYGGMWRAFPYSYDAKPSPEISGAIQNTYNFKGTVDQIQKIIDKLKFNPDDRRMIVSAWHPYWVDHCALPPCHVMFHFNTEELTQFERSQLVKGNEGDLGIVYLHDELDRMDIPRRKLNCLLYQRSCDLFLGVPFNITSYCLLTAMIAHCVNMIPGEFIHTYGDLHIYTNHLDQVKEQLSREPKKLPKLWINPEKKDLFDIKYEDVKLIDYESHPSINGKVAV